MKKIILSISVLVVIFIAGITSAQYVTAQNNAPTGDKVLMDLMEQKILFIEKRLTDFEQREKDTAEKMEGQNKTIMGLQKVLARTLTTSGYPNGN